MHVLYGSSHVSSDHDVIETVHIVLGIQIALSLLMVIDLLLFLCKLTMLLTKKTKIYSST